jgi:hypothetical protein
MSQKKKTKSSKRNNQLLKKKKPSSQKQETKFSKTRLPEPQKEGYFLRKIVFSMMTLWQCN